MKYLPRYLAIFLSVIALCLQLQSSGATGHLQRHDVRSSTTKSVQKKTDTSKSVVLDNASIAMDSSVDSSRFAYGQRPYYKKGISNQYWLLWGILIIYAVVSWFLIRRTRLALMHFTVSEDEAEELIFERRRRMRNALHTIIFIGLGILLLGSSMWIMNAPDRILAMGVEYHKKFEDTGVVGDTYGGLIGPWIALIGAILTFLAFIVQYRANILQREQFEASFRAQKRQFNKTISEQQDASRKQEEQANRERFESRFFELLKLHKANVNEMDLGNQITKGRRCFFSMFAELKMIYTIIETIKGDVEKQTPVDPSVNILKIAYAIFYNGMVNNGSFLDGFTTEEKTFYEHHVSAELELFRSGYYEEDKVKHIPQFLEWYRDLDYEPCRGHFDKLGHYYRHLFQTAVYIRDTSLIDEVEKLNYLKTLRAQLSDHEQLMLYYNGIIWFEEEWNQLFTTCRFIKNVPLDLATLGKKPTAFYEKEMVMMFLTDGGRKMFEQQGNIDEIIKKYPELAKAYNYYL